MPTDDAQPKLLHVLVEPSLRQQLDDYRYANRIPTLAEAVRQLIRRGLSAEFNRSAMKTPGSPHTPEA